MGLIIAALLLIAFTANVTMGSITGAPVLGNVGEMILLFAASIAFVADVLRREAAAKRNQQEDR